MSGGAADAPGVVSDAVADETRALEESARELGRATFEALAAHRQGIERAELVQERLAEAAMNVYVGFACASRLDAALRERGVAGCASEVLVARKAIRDALGRVRGHLGSLRANDDDLVRSASGIMTRADAWPFPLVP